MCVAGGGRKGRGGEEGEGEGRGGGKEESFKIQIVR